MTHAQMRDMEQKAIGARGVLPLLQSSAKFKSKAEIEAMMRNDQGSYGLKDVGGSKVTAQQLRQEPTKFKKLKFVILGDGAAGKTYAIMKYLRGHTNGIPYAATVYANYTSDIKVDSYHCQVTWEDTTGQEEYDRLRPLAYPHAHVALIVFSIDSPDSLDNILEKWQAEIFHFLPWIPKILVGTKSDLRNDARTIEELAKTSHKPVSREQGEEVAAKIAKTYQQFSPKIKYMECSSYTGEGITDVFEEAARLGIEYTNTAMNKKLRRLSSLFRRSKALPPSPEVSQERLPPEGSLQNLNNFRIVTQASGISII
jgi:Ras family protein A